MQCRCGWPWLDMWRRGPTACLGQYGGCGPPCSAPTSTHGHRAKGMGFKGGANLASTPTTQVLRGISPADIGFSIYIIGPVAEGKVHLYIGVGLSMVVVGSP